MSLRQPSTGAIAAVAMGSTVMLAMLFVVAWLVVRWCPRGEDCQDTGRILYGLGLMVSLALSVAAGFVTRDIVERLAANRPR